MEDQDFSKELELKTLRRNIYLLLFLVLFILFYFLMIAPPKDFPKESMQIIEQGASLRSVSLNFKENKFIKSRIVFETLVMLYGDEKKIIAGYYYFEQPMNVFLLAKRIAVGERNVESLKITIPEGFDREQIANLLSSRLPLFDRNVFLEDSKYLEGYLFPDTYFFLPESSVEDVLASLKENYEEKISPLRGDIVSSGKNEKDIIIMSSIIEREAKGEHDRAQISGILWRRIKIGMALQADAAPVTYEHRGLPESPIANPGLAAIKASIHPAETSYLYYIHDKDGQIYFAKTFDEHRQNIAKYLK